MSEKTLEPVQPEDETKPTGDQEDVPSQEDEESADDIDELDDDESQDGDEEDEGGKKPFKTRKERAAYFKKKQQEEKPEGDVLKRSEFYQANEKKAIRLATEPQKDDDDSLVVLKSEINDNWKEIVPFFNRSTDRSDPETIEQAIYDAHAAWRRRNPKSAEDTDTAARRKLSREQGVKGSSAKGAEATKKSILGKPSKGMDDWYPGEDN